MRSIHSYLATALRVFLALLSGLSMLASALSGTAADENANATKVAREQFIKFYGAKSLDGRFYGAATPDGRFEADVVKIKLVVTAVEDDPEEPEVGRLFSSAQWYGCEVSTDWRVHSFYHSNRGTKGGGSARIPENDQKRLDVLIAKLPDAPAAVPPAGRRLLIQVAEGDRYASRIYDRGNAPNEILEILRLTLSGIKSWLPEFKPLHQWKVGYYSEGIFSLTPDGQTIIAEGKCDPLKFWDPETRQLVKEGPRGGWLCPTEIAFSPDGSLAAAAGGGRCAVFHMETWERLCALEEPTIGGTTKSLESPRFTPDGEYLLLECAQEPVRVFDTKNWKRRDPPPYFPDGVVTYLPASKTRRAVIRAKRGAVALWDADQMREYATLDESARLRHVSFSADESLAAVAMVTGNWETQRIGIWKMDTGAMVHELRPFERAAGLVEGLRWTPDDQYILGATKADGFFTSRGISVWSVKSGRHRGDLTGCPARVNGLAILDGGRKVAAGCQDGNVRIWDFEAARRQIAEFEHSLIPAPPTGAR